MREQIHESVEDYLETILLLRQRQGRVRSIDIVNELGYSKPSISVAMKRLRENGLIVMESDSTITLTPTGEDIAERIAYRHRLLTEFLIKLGVSTETAATDACRMEHVLSEETFEKLKTHVLRICQPE